MKTVDRYLRWPNAHFFLFGPRGTGKTVWTLQDAQGTLHFDLLDPSVFNQFNARPETLEQTVLQEKAQKRVVIDEIQKIPELLDVIHRLIEQKTGQQFVMTGSSARKLRRQGTNLLGGRAQMLHMHPYMASELGPKSFVLDEALRYGTVPLIYAAEDKGQQLQAYLKLYLEQEVQMEGLTRNISAFGRFLESMSYSHASVLNASNVARDASVKQRTVSNYIEILEDLLLGYRLPVFSKRAKRHLAAAPKFYFFDAGVYQTIRPKGPMDTTSEVGGHALEGLVAQNLKAWVDYTAKEHKLYYWQTRAGVEVDFILYGEEHFHAIEVKHAQKIDPRDLNGLKHFTEDYPQAKPVLLYRGKHAQRINDIPCLPVERFLFDLKPDSWPEY